MFGRVLNTTHNLNKFFFFVKYQKVPRFSETLVLVVLVFLEETKCNMLVIAQN